MTNLFTSQIEELEKGCGYRVYGTKEPFCGDEFQGDIHYCKECFFKKQAFLQAEEVCKKKVEELNDVFRKHFGNGNDLWFCLNATNQIFLDNQSQVKDKGLQPDSCSETKSSNSITKTDLKDSSPNNTQPQNPNPKEEFDDPFQSDGFQCACIDEKDNSDVFPYGTSMNDVKQLVKDNSEEHHG